MFKTYWHDVVHSAERARLWIRGFVLTILTTALQMALDPSAMETWTTRRWFIFGGIVLLSALTGTLKAGQMNAPPVSPT